MVRDQYECAHKIAITESPLPYILSFDGSFENTELALDKLLRALPLDILTETLRAYRGIDRWELFVAELPTGFHFGDALIHVAILHLPNVFVFDHQISDLAVRSCPMWDHYLVGCEFVL
jgi:hypothetical protein